jgi:hypothetical protein
MAGPTLGIQAVCTLTVGASGGSDSQSVLPVRSNAPFKNLSLSIVPCGDPSPYQVSVYHDGEIVEQHSFPDANGRVVCHMSFPNVIFPANTGTDTIPAYYNTSRHYFPGIPVRVTIDNYDSRPKSFYVYACFEAFEPCAFQKLSPEV